ncbi:hypothetical protein Q9S36_29425 [Microbacterium sp. ARD31]|uniref:McrC family protein n=1 Tax=Microbacterium sp. ARD31 TaxID=2962576 RepID=UPI002881D9C6|nr:hypothetical protein [Microbacterium sp. ARD31]MDT0184323.1 hypothetical protein [Microbacterium sp. ARD31]
MSLLPQTLTESRPAVVQIDDLQAESLQTLGRRLAGRSDWWGAAKTAGQDASAISVARTGSHGQWTLRVNDAIGILSVGGQTVPVLPKIPESHALELLSLAGAIPRMDTLAARAASGTSLFDLLSRWLVYSVERVLRRDLMKDYQAHHEVLAHVRGRIDIRNTTLAVTRGRARVTCEFDELDRDSALNRVLLAALRLVSGAPFAASDVRNKARRASTRFDEVSQLRPSDLRVTVSPSTAYYSDSLALAKALLRGAARKLDAGGEVAWAFLIRTPEAIEAGIRRVLQDALAPAFTVEKRGMALMPSTKTLNPDLVFNGLAIGDVKYKVQGADWDTGDLYQAVAFATGFRMKRAAILTFSKGQNAHAPLQVGDVLLSNFCWPADPSLGSQEAATRLVTDVRGWLDEISAP